MYIKPRSGVTKIMINVETPQKFKMVVKIDFPKRKKI